jgi:Zn-dependent protease
MPRIDPVYILYLIPVIILSLSFHELAHAVISYMLGDPTARNAGRITLNPMKHLDPLGTIMLFISLIYGTGIGWAKPVPINPMYYRNRKFGTLLVSLAGPLANIFLAFVFSFPLQFIILKYADSNLSVTSMTLILYKLSSLFVITNISLAIFNLLPVPPLDGSKILSAILPSQQYYKFIQYENIIAIIFICIVFIFPSQLGAVMAPFQDAIANMLNIIVKPIVSMLI